MGICNEKDVNNNKKTEEYIDKTTIILIILLILSLSFLGYLFYKDYKLTIENYEKQIDSLHSTISLKTQDINTYKNEVNHMYRQTKFMDKHVAICPLDGSGLFHKYGCEHLDISSFMIYNTEQAPNEGYSPCPYCFGETSNTSNDKTEIVYITNTGSKYHRSGCSYLKSKKAITKENAISRGYSPCSRCNP